MEKPFASLCMDSGKNIIKTIGKARWSISGNCPDKLTGYMGRHFQSIRSLAVKGIQALFRLTFEGKTFFHGIVKNQNRGFGKDVALSLLRLNH
jgi:hypothetical protein